MISNAGVEQLERAGTGRGKGKAPAFSLTVKLMRQRVCLCRGNRIGPYYATVLAPHLESLTSLQTRVCARARV